MDLRRYPTRHHCPFDGAPPVDRYTLVQSDRPCVFFFYQTVTLGSLLGGCWGTERTTTVTTVGDVTFCRGTTSSSCRLPHTRPSIHPFRDSRARVVPGLNPLLWRTEVFPSGVTDHPGREKPGGWWNNVDGGEFLSTQLRECSNLTFSNQYRFFRSQRRHQGSTRGTQLVLSSESNPVSQSVVKKVLVGCGLGVWDFSEFPLYTLNLRLPWVSTRQQMSVCLRQVIGFSLVLNR